jgi:hypothetical protein
MNMAQTNLSRRDSLKTARRFNAGIGLDCASSPGGTAENARPFRPSLRDSVPIASQPGVETPGYCRSSLRDKTPARQTNWGNLVAKRLDCGVFSAALSRRLASRRTKSGDESPQSRRFAPFVGAHEFVEARV